MGKQEVPLEPTCEYTINYPFQLLTNINDEIYTTTGGPSVTGRGKLPFGRFGVGSGSGGRQAAYVAEFAGQDLDVCTVDPNDPPFLPERTFARRGDVLRVAFNRDEVSPFTVVVGVYITSICAVETTEAPFDCKGNNDQGSVALIIGDGTTTIGTSDEFTCTVSSRDPCTSENGTLCDGLFPTDPTGSFTLTWRTFTGVQGSFPFLPFWSVEILSFTTCGYGTDGTVCNTGPSATNATGTSFCGTSALGATVELRNQQVVGTIFANFPLNWRDSVDANGELNGVPVLNF